MSRPATADEPRPRGALRVGRVAGAPIYVQRSWLLVAALISVLVAPRAEAVAPGIGALAYVAGLGFAVLLYVSVLVHEVSHALAARGCGMRVLSVSLHFLGGVTQLDGRAETPRRELWIAIVGPLSSAAVGAVSYAGSVVAPDGLVHAALLSLAVANGFIAVLNMLPGLPLDGGAVLHAVAWRLTGDHVRATRVAAWSGRAIALLVLALPLLPAWWYDLDVQPVDVLLAAVVALFVWTAASDALRAADVDHRLRTLRARDLARPAVGVRYDLDLDTALRRAGERAVVVLDAGGRPQGLVHDQAARATPPERREHVPVASVSSALPPDAVIADDLVAMALVRALQPHLHTAYVLLDEQGSVTGLLLTDDVEAALSGGRVTGRRVPA